MVILTGGAGFIGSCFLWKLNKEGIKDIIVVDNLNDKHKENNLKGKCFRDYIPKDEFLTLVEKGKAPHPRHIIHLGACSSTILDDWDYYFKNNYEYSKKLAEWSLKEKANFLYASSAATYGDGSFGYDDTKEATLKLKPLNMYGKSKQLFDLWLLKEGYEDRMTGLKFFNVFGPNEYHKGEMRSVICKKFPEVKDRGEIKLFRSYRKDYKDGEQKRDFIYVKDAIEVMYYFFLHPEKSGIFNLGTGVSSTWNDVARAMFKALGKDCRIKYIDMPAYLKDQYQYFTQAKIEKLRQAGCRYKFSSLEEAIKDYIEYLKEGRYL